MMTSLPTRAAGLAIPAAALLTMLTATAEARSACAPRDAVIDRLASGFGETRQSIGLGADNRLVEVFASAETGTWTITVTDPRGLTCLVASGQAFEPLAERPARPGDDA
jgi:hypothetical protein